jgi:phage tail protein X
VLELNRDLAGEGPILAEGRVIVLPLLLEPPVQQREMVQLWD